MRLAGLKQISKLLSFICEILKSETLSLCVRSDAECDFKLQFQQKLEQERSQWAQYREAMEREVAELRRRLSQGQEEENLENEMKKVQS